MQGTLEEMVYARQIYKQQAANTAIEGARERRYFEGVKGVQGHEGELWGLANLFKLTAETVATRDIIVAAEQKELSYSIEAFDVANAGEGCLQPVAYGVWMTCCVLADSTQNTGCQCKLHFLHRQVQAASSGQQTAYCTYTTQYAVHSEYCVYSMALTCHALQGDSRSSDPVHVCYGQPAWCLQQRTLALLQLWRIQSLARLLIQTQQFISMKGATSNAALGDN